MADTRFIFWQRFLFSSSIAFAVFALFYAFNPDLEIFLPFTRAVNFALFNCSDIAESAKIFRDYIYGPLGGTVAASYVLLAFVAYYPFKRKEKWARTAVLSFLIVWAAADSVLCWRAGVYFQVYVINVISVMQKLLPLIFTWRRFNSE